jgi:hypothetical protein
VVRPVAVDRWLEIRQSPPIRRATGRVGGALKALDLPPR